MPKVELHRHLEGSLRPDFLNVLAKRHGISFPFRNENDFYEKNKFRSFSEFIPFFLLGLKYLRTLEDFSDAVFDLGWQLKEDNTRYAEVTFTPQLYRNRHFSYDELLKALNKGRERVKEKFGVVIVWIPDLVRHKVTHALEVGEWLLSFDLKANHIVALGLGGDEVGFSITPFESFFKRCEEKDLFINPHAGEAGDVNILKETIEKLNVKRIGHGIKAIDDSHVLAEVISRNIVLEICLSSNLKLNVCDENNHPLKQLLEHGCRITLNTDDPTLFRTTLCNEFLLATKNHGLTWEDLKECSRNAIESSYMSDHEKNKMLEVFNQAYLEIESR